MSAYRDWADFEVVAGERFVTVTVGLVFCPTDGPYSAGDFTASLDAVGVVALGAGHAFKFTPAIGRVLAELAVDGGTTDDISTFTPVPRRPPA